eukprot:TRINITY_DN989_c0_g1_i13.p1 TRINITY_DN989_c0_g1~~TRINITY_DN989_c0_g1_i13.p1  ORF type:complete len:810 (-),score=207.14 TRINITY_DN989_c0_g1_i13:944-3373(-)
MELEPRDALLMNEIFDSIVRTLGVDNEALLTLSRTVFLEYCRSVSDSSRLIDHAQYIAAASIYASSRSSGDPEIPPVTFSSLALLCRLNVNRLHQMIGLFSAEKELYKEFEKTQRDLVLYGVMFEKFKKMVRSLQLSEHKDLVDLRWLLFAGLEAASSLHRRDQFESYKELLSCIYIVEMNCNRFFSPSFIDFLRRTDLPEEHYTAAVATYAKVSQIISNGMGIELDGPSGSTRSAGSSSAFFPKDATTTTTSDAKGSRGIGGPSLIDMGKIRGCAMNTREREAAMMGDEMMERAARAVPKISIQSDVELKEALAKVDKWGEFESRNVNPRMYLLLHESLLSSPSSSSASSESGSVDIHGESRTFVVVQPSSPITDALMDIVWLRTVSMNDDVFRRHIENNLAACYDAKVGRSKEEFISVEWKNLCDTIQHLQSRVVSLHCLEPLVEAEKEIRIRYCTNLTHSVVIAILQSKEEFISVEWKNLCDTIQHLQSRVVSLHCLEPLVEAEKEIRIRYCTNLTHSVVIAILQSRDEPAARFKLLKEIRFITSVYLLSSAVALYVFSHRTVDGMSSIDYAEQWLDAFRQEPSDLLKPLSTYSQHLGKVSLAKGKETPVKLWNHLRDIEFTLLHVMIWRPGSRVLSQLADERIVELLEKEFKFGEDTGTALPPAIHHTFSRLFVSVGTLVDAMLTEMERQSFYKVANEKKRFLLRLHVAELVTHALIRKSKLVTCCGHADLVVLCCLALVFFVHFKRTFQFLELLGVYRKTCSRLRPSHTALEIESIIRKVHPIKVEGIAYFESEKRNGVYPFSS